MGPCERGVSSPVTSHSVCLPKDFPGSALGKNWDQLLDCFRTTNQHKLVVGEFVKTIGNMNCCNEKVKHFKTYSCRLRVFHLMFDQFFARFADVDVLRHLKLIAHLTEKTAHLTAVVIFCHRNVGAVRPAVASLGSPGCSNDFENPQSGNCPAVRPFFIWFLMSSLSTALRSGHAREPAIGIELKATDQIARGQKGKTQGKKARPIWVS